MPKKMRTFQRPLGERRYKKIFVVSMEGTKTEPQYFTIVNLLRPDVLVKCLKRSSTKSSPIQVLKVIKGYLRKERLRKTDEAWIVVDKDDWTEDQLKELLKWANERENYGLAISDPNFEYWILLHFEDGKGVANSQECLSRLKRHLPDYKKDIDGKKITLDLIAKAISRARQRDTITSNDLPKKCNTSVYKLVEKILDHK